MKKANIYRNFFNSLDSVARYKIEKKSQKLLTDKKQFQGRGFALATERGNKG